MLLKPEQLGRHLEELLRPVYFVGGDELLLVEDACRAIVQTASDRGFPRKSVMT